MTTTTEIKGSSTSTACRICYEDDTTEELIEPCECSGSLGLIHASCLERWLSTWNTDRCEICKYDFAVERKNKPLPQSFFQWWRTRGVYEPQGVTGDAVRLLILTPLCLAATYLCAVGARAYARLGFWEGTGLAVLCCLLVATYFLWFFVTIRFHYKSWRQWCKRNQDVRLLVKCKIADDERKTSTLVKDKDKADQSNDDDYRPRRSDVFGRLSMWLNFSINQNTEPIFNLHQQTSFV